MVDLKSITLTTRGEFIVDRSNLLFCLCPVCLNQVNWRSIDATYELTASCCCIAFLSYPANSKASMYRIECKPANMKNVYWLHRRGADTYFNGPQKA